LKAMQLHARLAACLLTLSVGARASRKPGHARGQVLSAVLASEGGSRQNLTGGRNLCDPSCNDMPPEFKCAMRGMCDGCPECVSTTPAPTTASTTSSSETTSSASTSAPTTTQAAPTTPSPAPYAKLIQMGHFTLKNSYTLGTMPNAYMFALPFEEPPVVIILPTTDGPNPATIRVRDVTTTGFAAWLTEPPGEDGPHKEQDVSYLAAVPGEHALPDGRKFEVGKVSTRKQVTKRCRRSGFVEGWEYVMFSASFTQAPAFITGLQSMNNEVHNVPLETSKPFLTVATKGLQKSGSMVSLGLAETSRKGTAPLHEIIGWMAFEPGASAFTGKLGANAQCAAILSGDVVDGWRDRGERVPFPVDLGTPTPLIVGSQSSYRGLDGGWLRLKSIDAQGATVVIDEDRFCDRERGHTKEKVSLFACNVPFTL